MPEVAYKEIYEPEEITYRMPMLRSEVNIMRRDVENIKNDMTELTRDTSSLRSDITELKSNTRIIQNDVAALKSDVKDLSVEVSDLKGEIRTLGARLDGMDRRIDDLHESHTKWFTLLGLLITVVPIAIAVIQHVISK